jgi:hypothetical protein
MGVGPIDTCIADFLEAVDAAIATFLASGQTVADVTALSTALTAAVAALIACLLDVIVIPG